MSKLKFINVFFLQWFFVRLTKCQETVIEEFNLYEVSLMSDGSFASGGTVKKKIYQWYSLQFWIVPCTGWWNSFKYVSKKPKFLRLSAKHIV
mgnify:CR=1 FL=1